MEYRTTYRRTSFAIPGLVALVALYIAGIAAIFYFLAGNEVIDWFMAATGLMLAGLAGVVLSTYRLHCWTLHPHGLQISERPRVPMTGFRRNADLDFGEIVGVNRIESGIDRYVDIISRDGRRFRMPQAIAAWGKASGAQNEPPPSLDDFFAAIEQAALVAGSPLPTSCEALGFFNSIAGLALLFLLFVLVLGFAGLVAWAILDGAEISTYRSGGSAIVMFLPIGAGWLLMRSLRRRRDVLARRA